MARERRRRLLLLSTLLVLAGCTHLGYYARSATGGLELLAQRRPIKAVVADPRTSPDLAATLRRVQEIRRFASRELALPDDKSYTTYVDLDRDAVVWTVVAAPELSVSPIEWCFLVVGCVSYRGYFSQARAERFADKLSDQSLDVVVDGRAAYSTLGRFADPVLSTFVDLPEPRLAGLLFHELAHRVVFVPGDTDFNESFATAVELEGIERWLSRPGQEAAALGPPEDVVRRYREGIRWEQRIGDLYRTARDRLAETYAADRPDAWKRERKTEVFTELRARLLEEGAAERSFEPLNNARLASVGAYTRWVGAFEALLESQRSDLVAFYAEVERLARLPETARRAALLLLGGREGDIPAKHPAPGTRGKGPGALGAVRGYESGLASQIEGVP